MTASLYKIEKNNKKRQYLDIYLIEYCYEMSIL